MKLESSSESRDSESCSELPISDSSSVSELMLWLALDTFGFFAAVGLALGAGLLLLFLDYWFSQGPTFRISDS